MAKQVDMRPGERIVVSGPAVFTVVYKRGSKTRIAVEAVESTLITFIKTEIPGKTAPD